jgi:hypothetical protein
MIFNPDKLDVRRFFCEAWRKERTGLLLTPIERMAAKWLRLHPEYHELIEDRDAAVNAEFSIEHGESNPFLHLSMHLAIDEQLSIDQPTGVRAVFEMLAARTGDGHSAAHEAMECLGRVMWEAQRNTLPSDPDAINAAYLECLQRRVG